MSMIFNRYNAIQALVDNDKDYINSSAGGLEWVETILKTGFSGYDNQPDEELVKECIERDIPESYYFDEE